MDPFLSDLETRPYTPRAMGRPLTKSRPKQGAHLAALRKAAGLTQAELAEAVGVPQGNIAYWETCSKPPRSDVLPQLAKVLGVRVEDLLGEPRSKSSPPPLSATSGPISQLQRTFEEVRKLPRSKQRKVVEVVAALLQQYRRTG